MNKHSVECLVMMRAIWNIQKVGLGNASSRRWYIDKIIYFQHILRKNPHHHQTVHMVSKTLYCELQKCWWKTTNRLRPWNTDCGKRSIFMGERQSSALVLLKKSLRSRVINESLHKLRGLITTYKVKLIVFVWNNVSSTSMCTNSLTAYIVKLFVLVWKKVSSTSICTNSFTTYVVKLFVIV